MEWGFSGLRIFILARKHGEIFSITRNLTEKSREIRNKVLNLRLHHVFLLLVL